MREVFLKIVSDSPELNCSVFVSMCLFLMTKKMNQFLRHIIIVEEYCPGSTSTQLLFSIGTVLGEEPAGSLLCGFAFAFDRHAKSFATSGISYSLLFKFVTNLFDP